MILWEVEPVVTHSYAKQSGLDVRLAQRCDDMAQNVTGRPDLASAENRYWEAIADLLGELTDTPRDYYVEEYHSRQDGLVSATKQGDQQAIQAARDRYTRFMTTMLRRVMRLRDDPNDTSGSLDFHYAGVIVKSGEDYITMENYARHESQDTLSSNDPQWYFQMYSSSGKQSQSFHEDWGWGGNKDRFTLTILISG